MEAKKNVYEMVTERIIAKMQEGIIPWHQPWGNLSGKDVDINTMAVSWSSKSAYSLLNQFLLGGRPSREGSEVYNGDCISSPHISLFLGDLRGFRIQLITLLTQERKAV